MKREINFTFSYSVEAVTECSKIRSGIGVCSGFRHSGWSENSFGPAEMLKMIRAVLAQKAEV